MTVLNYILATAGHIDHGKSALVRALTGIDPDRLPEEKARGITIELGFAHLDLPSPRGKPPATYRVGIVDVPGHEDFVKSMVAGVGSIDAALLVVAADDGWMPQTEEHLQILSYLGVCRGIIALSKIDLVASEESARAALREKLAGTFFAEAPIIATSMRDGRGFEELKSAIAFMLAESSPQPDIGKPRLAVDRVFIVRGSGTVVTGTLTGGALSHGQTIAVQPGARPARIRSVQSYNREIEQALPGSRVALNLPDLHPAASAASGAIISRGDVVTTPELGGASDTIDAKLEKSPRDGNSRPLKEATRVRVHHGSGNFPGIVYFNGVSELSAGEHAIAQLRLDSPVFVFAGDRFIIRDWSEQQTLAGGIVLDPDAMRRGFRSAERRQFLERQAAASAPVDAFVASQIERDRAVAIGELLRKSRFSFSEIEQAVERLVRSGAILVRDNVAIDAAWWLEQIGSASAAIEQFHRDHPEQSGTRLLDLRKSMGRGFAAANVFDALVDQLCHDGFARIGTGIRRATHQPALPPHLQAAGKRIRSVLASKPLDPPSRKELSRDSIGEQALRFLIQSGEAVEIGGELVISAEAYQAALQKIRDQIAQHGPATVSELRQVLGTSRRVMVPLLEKMDDAGLTLRQGDKRTLKPTVHPNRL